MKLQSFFCSESSQELAKHEFLQLSLHLSKWNESKLPMFIKIYTLRRNFEFFLENNFEIFFTLSCVVHISSKILKTS